VKSAVVAPIGFVSDHMEVVYDLDVEAKNVAREVGLEMVRARTVGTHPSFVSMIRELMLERIDNEAPAASCAPDCCKPF
jgi:ferrochelatase